MPDFHSYLEPINSGGYVAHAHEDGNRTLCGLVIYDLVPWARVVAYNRIVICPHCAREVHGESELALRLQFVTIIPQAMEGNDG